MENYDDKYLSIKDFSNRYQSFSESGLRWMIFSNPLFEEKTVRRMGRRIFLNVDAVWEFIENQSENKQR